MPRANKDKKEIPEGKKPERPHFIGRLLSAALPRLNQLRTCFLSCEHIDDAPYLTMATACKQMLSALAIIGFGPAAPLQAPSPCGSSTNNGLAVGGLPSRNPSAAGSDAAQAVHHGLGNTRIAGPWGAGAPAHEPDLPAARPVPVVSLDHHWES